MSTSNMDEFARQDLRHVFAKFGIYSVKRVVDTDPTEEIFLVSSVDFASIDATTVTREVMDVLPHVKVWVIEDNPAWKKTQSL